VAMPQEPTLGRSEVPPTASDRAVHRGFLQFERPPRRRARRCPSRAARDRGLGARPRSLDARILGSALRELRSPQSARACAGNNSSRASSAAAPSLSPNRSHRTTRRRKQPSSRFVSFLPAPGERSALVRRKEWGEGKSHSSVSRTGHDVALSARSPRRTAKSHARGGVAVISSPRRCALGRGHRRGHGVASHKYAQEMRPMLSLSGRGPSLGLCAQWRPHTSLREVTAARSQQSN
jgi:hypothetical protein